MNKHDRQMVKGAKDFPGSNYVPALVLIIERLDKQLTEVVEAGEQMLRVPIKGEQHREAFYRLAEALKEVKDD